MYLLDTNIVSFFFKKNFFLQKPFAENFDKIALCSIVCAELLFGTRKVRNNVLETKYFDFFENFPIYDFDFKACNIFANLKAKLGKDGLSIEDFDLMIASICLVNKLTLVTNNTKHFNRIEGLEIVDWSSGNDH
jgi:tRNA(fMet)-specific endonuclease VapC